MKGHVPTPAAVVDLMVAKLFATRAPKPTETLLDPGCGTGEFVLGVHRYCDQRRLEPPKILGIELNPVLLDQAERRFGQHKGVQLLEADYLDETLHPCEFIVGNPPYVSIIGLDEDEKTRYRKAYSTAVGRFDLYLLFFEKSLRNLRAGGRLCFITPEKFEYVQTAEPLRKMLTAGTLEELHHVDESTFEGLVTYPTITTFTKMPSTPNQTTRVIARDVTSSAVTLPRDGRSWMAALNGAQRTPKNTLTLADVATRVSCGIATGCDDVFVQPTESFPVSLRPFARPTVSGKQLSSWTDKQSPSKDVMLIPYDNRGNLLPEGKLGPLGTYLRRPDISRRLQERTCVTEGGRVWYRFHDNAPLDEILAPKILCKDITPEPRFWFDQSGQVVPRHSVYYIIPKTGVSVKTLMEYLNGEKAGEWLRAHCQRAANGFFRLQSSVLKDLPVPTAVLPNRLAIGKG